jgi:hypothetical protein
MRGMYSLQKKLQFTGISKKKINFEKEGWVSDEKYDRLF